MVRDDVTLVRPDSCACFHRGDGPASDFYYNGKTMSAYAPAENLLAVASAPPTIDANGWKRPYKQGRDLLSVYPM